jgi:hypothetical protein
LQPANDPPGLQVSPTGQQTGGIRTTESAGVRYTWFDYETKQTVRVEEMLLYTFPLADIAAVQSYTPPPVTYPGVIPGAADVTGGYVNPTAPPANPTMPPAGTNPLPGRAYLIDDYPPDLRFLPTGRPNPNYNPNLRPPAGAGGVAPGTWGVPGGAGTVQYPPYPTAPAGGVAPGTWGVPGGAGTVQYPPYRRFLPDGRPNPNFNPNYRLPAAGGVAPGTGVAPGAGTGPGTGVGAGTRPIAPPLPKPRLGNGWYLVRWSYLVPSEEIE